MRWTGLPLTVALWGERFDKLDALLADLQRPPERKAPEPKGREREGPEGRGGREGHAGMGEHGAADGAPNQLHFSRVFEAPRELVFRCMIDADHLTHFWGPAGVSAPRERITVDARAGGVFETVMVNDADGSEYPTHAVYDEVREPELLAWTETHSGMRVRTEFVALGPRPHRSADPPDLRARGLLGPRGPGRVRDLARSLRRVSRPDHPTRIR